MSVLHMQPVQFKKPPTKGVYKLPVYKILSRWGVLATTGHSSNFVMWLDLPSNRNNFINNADQGILYCFIFNNIKININYNLFFS